MLSHLKTLLEARITVLVYITHFAVFYPCFVRRALCSTKYSKIRGTRERLERKEEKKKACKSFPETTQLKMEVFLDFFFPSCNVDGAGFLFLMETVNVLGVSIFLFFTLFRC